MRYAPHSLDAALMEAVGDDPALIADLRAAFLAGAGDHARRLAEATGDAERSAAAWKLHGLAASFGAGELMLLAEQAALGAGRDTALVARIRQAIEGFAG